jgi:hypothetical protein
MDILPIQASSVPSERVFSSGKETMTARRRCISPHLMEALQVVKFSIKKAGRSLEFTEGLSWSDEMKEFELAAHRALLGDADAYGRTVDVIQEDSDGVDDVVDDLVKGLESAEDGSDEGDEGDEDIYL